MGELSLSNGPEAASTPARGSIQGFVVPLDVSPIDVGGAHTAAQVLNYTDQGGDGVQASAASEPDIIRRAINAPSSSQSHDHGTDGGQRSAPVLNVANSAADGAQAQGMSVSAFDYEIDAPPSLPLVDDNIPDMQQLHLDDAPRQARSFDEMLRARGFPRRSVSINAMP